MEIVYIDLGELPRRQAKAFIKDALEKAGKLPEGWYKNFIFFYLKGF